MSLTLSFLAIFDLDRGRLFKFLVFLIIKDGGHPLIDMWAAFQYFAVGCRFDRHALPLERVV